MMSESASVVKIKPGPTGPLPPPPSLYAAIIKVARGMKPLAKRDTNPEGGWSFVSIDDYYEKAAKALLLEGISWVCTEEMADVRISGLCIWRFRFDVYSETGQLWQAAARVTVPLEYDGPQAAGKVVSYAEKVFLRQLLKLVTGEPDADITPQRKPTKRQVEPASTPKDDVSYEVLLDLIRGAKSQSDLDLVISRHKQRISWAAKNDPDAFGKLADARTAKIKEFEGDDDQVEI